MTFAQTDKSAEKKWARNFDMKSSLVKEAFSSGLFGAKESIWKASTKVRGIVRRG